MKPCDRPGCQSGDTRHGEEAHEPKTTDYGEPWKVCGSDRGGCVCRMASDRHGAAPVLLALSTKDENYTLGEGASPEHAKKMLARAIACVNALAGVPDPEAFVNAADALADSVESNQKSGDAWWLALFAAKNAYRAAKGGKG